MPNAVLKSIREVSSEDPVHNAKNLLKPESLKKWKTRNCGEKTAYVILELDVPAKIIGLDIGNQHSAFIEVSVSNSGCQLANFKDILVTSSFMTPIESKNSTQINRVRCFNTEALIADTLKENWNLIKVVCSQPFNKNVQYGLSFIKVRISDNVNLESISTNKLNIHTLIRAEDSSDSETENSFNQFKVWKINKNKEVLSEFRTGCNSNTQIAHKAAVPDEKNRNRNETSLQKVKKEVRQDKNGKTETGIRNPKENDDTTNASEKTETNTKGTQSLLKRKSEIRGDNMNMSILRSSEHRKFNELLNGVTVVISGIQNPERSELRQKALEMGAKYRTDWDDACTHLICAFINTPKYNQVKGKGKIVLKSWIESCYNCKKYIPWRRHALNPTDKLNPESDEEIIAESSNTLYESGSAKDAKKHKETLTNSSEEDTDDELTKIRSKKDIFHESTEEEEYIKEKEFQLSTNNSN